MLISPDNSIIKNVSLAFPKLSLAMTFLESVFIGTNISLFYITHALYCDLWNVK